METNKNSEHIKENFNQFKDSSLKNEKRLSKKEKPSSIVFTALNIKKTLQIK